MPYKVERGKVSFQCGTLSQKKITSATIGLEAKIAPTILNWILIRVQFCECVLSNFLIFVTSKLLNAKSK